MKDKENKQIENKIDSNIKERKCGYIVPIFYFLTLLNNYKKNQ